MAIGAAVIAAVGVASSASSASKQRKAAAQAQKKQDQALEKQEAIQAKADKLVAEQNAVAETKTTERRARLAQGRKGLLFEGQETGVTNKTDTLGG